MIEDLVTNVNRQGITNSRSAINVTKVTPLGLTKPSLKLSVLADILYSSKKQGLTLSNSLHQAIHFTKDIKEYHVQYVIVPIYHVVVRAICMFDCAEELLIRFTILIRSTSNNTPT